MLLFFTGNNTYKGGEVVRNDDHVWCTVHQVMHVQGFISKGKCTEVDWRLVYWRASC